MVLRTSLFLPFLVCSIVPLVYKMAAMTLGIISMFHPGIKGGGEGRQKGDASRDCLHYQEAKSSPVRLLLTSHWLELNLMALLEASTEKYF